MNLRGALEEHPEVVRALGPLRQAAAGAAIHLVGGTVRDLMLGAATVDLDVVVVGDAVAVARRLAAATGGKVAVHAPFGTAVVTGPVAVDLAGARHERYPQPGALPVVTPADALEDDLARRDFTINAMALALSEHAFGDLLDPFGGRQDMADSALRVLHPASFADDPTRLVRGARYAARLGFTFAPATRAAAIAAAPAVRSVGADRLRDALELAVREDAAVRAVAVLAELGVLDAIGAAPAPGALDRHDAFRQAHAPEAEAWVGRFALLGAAADLLPARVRRVSDIAARLAIGIPGCEADAPAIVRLLRRQPVEALVCAAAREPRAASGAAWYLDELRHVRLELDGDDLIRELGAEPGPALGSLLDALLARRLRGELPTRDEQLAAARAALR